MYAKTLGMPPLPHLPGDRLAIHIPGTSTNSGDVGDVPQGFPSGPGQPQGNPSPSGPQPGRWIVGFLPRQVAKLLAQQAGCTPAGCVTCDDSACSGTGSYVQLFMALQAHANVAAVIKGISMQVPVDGVIRQDTAALIKKILTGNLSIFLMITPAYVAANAQALLARISAITGPLPGSGADPQAPTPGNGGPSAGSPGVPTSADGTAVAAGPSTSVTTATPDASDAGSVSDLLVNAPLSYKLGAGVAILGAIAVGVSLFRHRRG